MIKDLTVKSPTGELINTIKTTYRNNKNNMGDNQNSYTKNDKQDHSIVKNLFNRLHDRQTNAERLNQDVVSGQQVKEYQQDRYKHPAQRTATSGLFMGIAKLNEGDNIPPEFLGENILSNKIAKPTNTNIPDHIARQLPGGRIIFENVAKLVAAENEQDKSGVRKVKYACYVTSGKQDGPGELYRTGNTLYVVDLIIQGDQRSIKKLDRLKGTGEPTNEVLDQYGVTQKKLYNIKLSLPPNGTFPDYNHIFHVYWLGVETDLEGIDWWDKRYAHRLYAIPQLVPGSGHQRVITNKKRSEEGDLGTGNNTTIFNSKLFNNPKAFDRLRKRNGRLIINHLIDKSVSRTGEGKDKELEQEDLIKPGQISLYATHPSITIDEPNKFEKVDPKLAKHIKGALNIARVIVDNRNRLSLIGDKGQIVHLQDSKVDIVSKEINLESKNVKLVTLMGMTKLNDKLQILPQGNVLTPHTQYDYVLKIFQLYDYVTFAVNMTKAIQAVSNYLHQSDGFKKIEDIVTVQLADGSTLRLVKDKLQEPQFDVWFQDGNTNTKPYYARDIRTLFKNNTISDLNKDIAITNKYSTINGQTADLITEQYNNALIPDGDTATDYAGETFGQRTVLVKYASNGSEIVEYTGIGENGKIISVKPQRDSQTGKYKFVDAEGNEYQEKVIG